MRDLFMATVQVLRFSGRIRYGLVSLRDGTDASINFLNDPGEAVIYTLSLHDALPISTVHRTAARRGFLPPGSAVVLARRLRDRKSTRLNSSHVKNSYAVFCLHQIKLSLKLNSS